MKKQNTFGCLVVCLPVLFFIWLYFFRHQPVPLDPRWGTAIDSYNNVTVYYNGRVGSTNGRNTAPDGYNLGMKYQCVEFLIMLLIYILRSY